MKKFNFKAVLGITGLSLLVVGVAVDSDIFNFSNLALRLSHATPAPGSVTLNSNNSPTLSGGSGTMVDNKGVTWEYSNCASYASGHVSINNGGYFNVSPSSDYGFTGISKITATFSCDSNELWLLKSVTGDENDWNEDRLLTSGEEVTTANDWRYIKFYNYSSDNTAINITSVVVEYTCSGTNAYDDADNARITNFLSEKSNNLNAVAEYTNISPIGNGTEAISFTKIDSSKSSYSVIKFNRTYSYEDIYTSKIEFDYYKEYTKPSTRPYAASVQLVDEEYKAFGQSMTYDETKSAYKLTQIDGYWWHVEVPITSIALHHCGYHYLNEKGKWVWENDPIPFSKIVGGVMISNGECVIDNLRISGTQSDLGIFNAGSSFGLNDGKPYLLKVSWIGAFHSVSYSFSPTNIAQQLPTTDPNLKNGSPFYIEGLNPGTVTVTFTMVIGYQHLIKTKSVTLQVNA